MAQLSFQNAQRLINKANQGHLLAFWDDLAPSQQDNLLCEIASIDLAQIDKWVNEFVLNKPDIAPQSDFKAAPYYKSAPENSQRRELYSRAIDTGRQAVSKGQVAAFVVAGGQGTRLGFDGPKGNFQVGPISNKTLFEMFAEQIAAVSKKYNTALPWYIMTSPLNHNQTVDIFETNDYFALGKDNVCLFPQGTLPNFGSDGRILLCDKDRIAKSPDGHGGSLRALYQSGAIDDMNKRGVKYISYFQVDNPLINIFDPLFVGLHIIDESEMSSKTIKKTGPKEKVGNFCLSGGKVTVIEYSDLPDEAAESRNEDSSLVFELGSIAIHMINSSFVEKLNAGGFSLPLHRADKKIAYIDADGNLIKPKEPNGVKLETFVFDALPLADRSMILETVRQREFAPVKNAAGVDSAESSRAMMIELWASWLKEAGVEIPRKPDGSPDAVIEIAASFALSAEDIKAKLDKIPVIKPGDKIYLQ